MALPKTQEEQKQQHKTDQHLIGAQAAIAIKVTTLEPVVQGHFTAFVLLTHDEPNKVLVPHFARLFRPEWPPSLKQSTHSM